MGKVSASANVCGLREMNTYTVAIRTNMYTVYFYLSIYLDLFIYIYIQENCIRSSR